LRFVQFDRIAVADLLNNCARLADNPVRGYDKFIDELVDRVAEVPEILLAANGEHVVGAPIYVTIESDDELVETIVRQLQAITDGSAA
jgi:hypothetical protein